MATNVASQGNGGTASSSSDFGGSYPAAGANNGDRYQNWTAGGMWASGNTGLPQWLQVDFNATYSINEIDVFSLQDAASPSPPTLSMTGSLYCVADFLVQYWDGAAWQTVSGGTVTGNNHIWAQFSFSAVSTSKIRVYVTAVQPSSQLGGAPVAVLAEVEAWTAPAVPSTPNTPSPADTATGISLTPTLSWAASGATAYDVYFGTAGSPPLVSSDQAAATYSPVGLSGSTTYHWKIVAKNSAGSTTGPVWSFTTASGVSASGMYKPTGIVEVELGAVGAGWTDISRDVRWAAGITIRRGIQGSTPKDLGAEPGTATFVLDNSTHNGLLGRYSPYHANCTSGWRQGKNCRIRFLNPNTGVYSTRFVGQVDAVDPVPGAHGARSVAVTLVDWLDVALRTVIPPSIGPQVGKRIDEILTAILAELPLQPTATSFDTGTEAFAYALDTVKGSQQFVLAEFAKLAASEYAPFYIKGDGTFRQESRHARLLNTTSVQTITENELIGLRLPTTREEIINVVNVVYRVRVVDPLPTTLIYDQPNVLAIPTGATQFNLASFSDQITGEQIGAVDVAVQRPQDLIANTSADGTGTDISSSLTVTLEIGPNGFQENIYNGNASTAYITVNRFYGRGVYDRVPQTAQSVDSASVDDNGPHPVTFEMPYQGNADVAAGAALYIKNRYSTAFPQARAIRVPGRTATLMAGILAREISDRITISESMTGLSGQDFFINGIEERLKPSGMLEADYILVPAADPASGLYWKLGTSTVGTNSIPAPF